MKLFENYPLMASLFSIIFAQFIKFPIAYFFKSKSANVSLVASTGGMPSSHSAAVSSLITALVLEYGFDSPLVAIATTFGLIVMFDSMGVRRQSGDQGVLLTHMHELFYKEHPENEEAYMIDDDSFEQVFESDKKLIIKKYLGHKPVEVFAGTITGIIVAFIFRRFFF